MRQRRGQGTVEFSLISILLFLTFCGIIEFSWVFYNLVYLNNAVSKAARKYVATDTTKGFGTASAAQQLLVDEKGGLEVASSVVLLYDESWQVVTTRTNASFVKVSAVMNYPRITPISNFIHMAGFGSMRAEAVAHIE